ncbi:MAG: hypothetical protein K2L72_03415, partial [Clostridia bacterium]|nr:hypothetical protein [Clostridia bacterium]
MKKDKDLERAFDEYFDAGKAPDLSVTDGAKNLIRHPKRISAPIRRALIAAACAASVFVSGAGLYFFPATVGNIADVIIGDNQAGSVQPPSVSVIEYYGAENLSESAIDVFADGAPAGLDFVKKLEFAKNYSVNSVNGYSADGDLAYVKAEFSAVVNAARHDAVVYAEYTETNSVCEIFEEYYDGERSYYGGYGYLCFYTEENGEPVRKLTLERDGVKYYVSVTSTDEFADR